jgi:hypothetical protein
MNTDGLGWTSSEIRQAQLIEWIIPQQNVGTYVPVKAFYDALRDLSANTDEVAYGDLRRLEQLSLLDLALGMGGLDAFHVRATAGARDLAEQRQSARADRGRRRAACRVAMLDWLYSHDAVREFNQRARELMLSSSAHGLWYGQPFTDDDLDGAAAWLFRNGYVKGITVDQAEGPVRLYLTDTGLTCAERYDSDVDRYAQDQQRQGGYSVNFGGDNYGQVAGHHARQEQHITTNASAEELRGYIVALAELVRAHVPQATAADTQLGVALAAARDGAVDKSVLQRFGDWVLSIFNHGATAALVPAVSSTVTAMMLEAGRQTGHL